MALQRPKFDPNKLIQDARRTRKASRETFKSELQNRIVEESKAGNTLLTPDEISGEYLLSRGLKTKLGGTLRDITPEDLKAFAHNVDQLKREFAKKRIKGGIKARSVIDLSTQIDRERAHAQITSALPTHYETKAGQGLLIHFRTNAAKGSTDDHHSVNVLLMDFFAAVASPADKAELAKATLKGSLKFECDCGRFRYWYRYIATAGAFVYGRAEPAFPKIRNPELRGIACKHILRVMTLIDQSPYMKTYLERVLTQFRKTAAGADKVESVADQRAIAEALKKESSRQKAVLSTEEKRAKRAGWKKPIASTQQKARKKAAAELSSKGKAKAEADAKSRLKTIQQQLGLSDEAFAAFLRAQAAALGGA